jgi:hypothetical protein
VAQRLSAFLDSEDPTSVQFHVQPPNDDGFMQKPWGYFSSAEHNISQNDKTIPAECQGVDNVSGKLLFQEIHLGYQMQSSTYVLLFRLFLALRLSKALPVILQNKLHSTASMGGHAS